MKKKVDLKPLFVIHIVLNMLKMREINNRPVYFCNTFYFSKLVDNPYMTLILESSGLNPITHGLFDER